MSDISKTSVEVDMVVKESMTRMFMTFKGKSETVGL